jgi:hypothetical protein
MITTIGKEYSGLWFWSEIVVSISVFGMWLTQCSVEDPNLCNCELTISFISLLGYTNTIGEKKKELLVS